MSSSGFPTGLSGSTCRSKFLPISQRVRLIFFLGCSEKDLGAFPYQYTSKVPIVPVHVKHYINAFVRALSSLLFDREL